MLSSKSFGVSDQKNQLCLVRIHSHIWFRRMPCALCPFSLQSTLSQRFPPMWSHAVSQVEKGKIYSSACESAVPWPWSMAEALAFRSWNSFPLNRMAEPKPPSDVAGTLYQYLSLYHTQDRNSSGEDLFIKFKGPSEWATPVTAPPLIPHSIKQNISSLFGFSSSPLRKSKMCMSSVGGMHSLSVSCHGWARRYYIFK